MIARTIPAILAFGIVIAGGLSGCEKFKGMFGQSAGADFRNGQIDVADTSCSDNAKLSTLMLQNGHYQLGSYDFSMLGDVKQGDVFGRTQPGTPEASVFVGNCVADGQASQVLFVYGTDENGKPKRLATADLSDADGGRADSFSLQDGTIVVEYNQAGRLTKTTYALLNGKMTDLTTGAVADEGSAGTDTISFEVFRDKLQPYGTWIDHPRWGAAWHPSEPGFKPYENGHWEDSEEYGTLWVSDDAWGDAPTHYGRWGYDPRYGGWLWIPGYVWAPSWVVWRASDQYVGWFPMPPGDYDGEGDYADDWADWYGYRQELGDEAAFFGLWSFVAPDDVYAVNIRTRIVDRRSYGRFIGRSRAWTHYGVSHGHVVSRGLDRARFRDTFHRALPASRHDFRGGRVTSLRTGHAVASRERAGGRDRLMSGRGGNDHGFRGMGPRNNGRDFSRNGGGFDRHNGNGFERRNGNGFAGGNFSRNGGGFTRNNGNGFARPNGNGFERHNGNGVAGAGFARHNGSGFTRSNGDNGGGFSRNGGGFTRNGGGFTRNNGNGFTRSNGDTGGGFSRNGGGFTRNNRNGFTRSNGDSGGGFTRNGGGGLTRNNGNGFTRNGGGGGGGSPFGNTFPRSGGGGGGNSLFGGTNRVRGGGFAQPSGGNFMGNNRGGGGARQNGGGNRAAPQQPKNENRGGGNRHH